MNRRKFDQYPVPDGLRERISADQILDGWDGEFNLIIVGLYVRSGDVGEGFWVAYLIGRLKPQLHAIKRYTKVVLQGQEIPWHVDAISCRKSVGESHKSKIPQDGQEPSGVTRLADR